MDLVRSLRWLGCSLVAVWSLVGYAGLAVAQEAEIAEPPNIITTDHAVRHVSTIPANAGEIVELFVRQRARANHPDQRPRKAVLLLHGVSVPVLTGFQLEHKHYDWSLELAKAGFDVFMVDFQGSGRSPRPKMDDPCNVPQGAAQQGLLIPNPLTAACPPNYAHLLINAQSDWDELDTVIDYIRHHRGVEKVAIVGWSHASVRMGPYAVQHSEKIDSLFFLAPIFSNAIPQIPAARQVGDTFLPPYKFAADSNGGVIVVPCTADELAKGGCPANVPPTELVLPGTPMTLRTRDNLLNLSWVPEIKCANQVEDGIPDVVWNSVMENDSLGHSWGAEGVMRVRSFALWGWNRQTAARISVPTLVIGGEFDLQAPPARLAELYDEIGNVPKLLFKVACAGHSIPWERQSKFLHEISKQWLKHGSVQGLSNGKFHLDTEGNLTPIP
jgi:pimeloyl-ACP methyl ester carboxylesterase